jgi:hypothetical protein
VALEHKDLYSIAVCKNLEILDLSDNPITTERNFVGLCLSLYQELKILNNLIIDAKQRPIRRPLDTISKYKECKAFYESWLNNMEREDPKSLKDGFTNVMAILSLHQNNILEYMGPDYLPYLDYLAREKSNKFFMTALMKNMMLDTRSSWLLGSLQKFFKDMENFLSEKYFSRYVYKILFFHPFI